MNPAITDMLLQYTAVQKLFRVSAIIEGITDVAEKPRMNVSFNLNRVSDLCSVCSTVKRGNLLSHQLLQILPTVLRLKRRSTKQGYHPFQRTS